MIANPKFIAKALYLMGLGFGIYYAVRFGFAFTASTLMGKFGKPQLVRETSKIGSNNPIMIPYLYGRKFV